MLFRNSIPTNALLLAFTMLNPSHSVADNDMASMEQRIDALEKELAQMRNLLV